MPVGIYHGVEDEQRVDVPDIGGNSTESFSLLPAHLVVTLKTSLRFGLECVVEE